MSREEAERLLSETICHDSEVAHGFGDELATVITDVDNRPPSDH